MKKHILILIGTMMLLLVVGCTRTSPPTTLYTLGVDPVVSGSGVESDITIGVDRVVLADYLKRSNLIIRDTDHKLSASNSKRWAGSLEDELNTAIAINLGTVAKTKRVFIQPTPAGMEMDYHVSVRIVSFDGSKNGVATLRAWWGVYNASRELIAHDVFSAQGHVTPSEDIYEDIVSAQSKLVKKLCDDIGASLK
ncbi:MAG: PqiC family protein [Pseudodesulfovibrio sp.]